MTSASAATDHVVMRALIREFIEHTDEEARRHLAIVDATVSFEELQRRIKRAKR